MKRVGVVLFVLSPLVYLLFLRLVPGADHSAARQLFHFNIVTFITFSASVISILLSWTLGENAEPRHYLSAVAFAAISVIFFSHGVVTPGILVPGLSPLLSWSAWLTLMTGGLIFAFASVYNRPWYPKIITPRVILWTTILFISGYFIVGVGRPDILNFITEQVAPWHQLSIFYLTLAFWTFAAFHFFRTWRKTNNTADAVLAFVSFWMAIASVSMHRFDVWLYSWWMYHFLMLIGFLLTSFFLIAEYEQARQFNLLRYFLAVSLNVIALLVLITTQFFTNATFNSISEEILRQSNRRTNDLIQGVAANLDSSLDVNDQLYGYMESLEQIGTLGFYIYDNNGRVYGVYSEAEAGSAYENEMIGTLVPGEKFEYFSKAMELNTIAEILEPGSLPPGYSSGTNTHTIVLYAPLLDPAGGGTIGVVEILDSLPELTTATRETRVTAITIAAVTTFALFVALLIVVSRGDRILFSRAKELNQAYIDLQRSEGIRDDLTRMIVHDLRNPLSAISASLDLIRMVGTESPQQKQFTNLAYDTTRRMSDLVDDLLTVAKYEAGELELKLSDNSVPQMLVPLMDFFKPQVETEDKRIKLECPPEMRAQFDQPLITRVIENLVSNAIKYIPSGNGQILVRAMLRNSRLIISVLDNGQGIPDEFKQAIFEKFIQVPETDPNIRKGTGLGLAFCRMVIEAHGGEIRVSDIGDGGSDFTFWIPAK